jgi:hypothetical protein
VFSPIFSLPRHKKRFFNSSRDPKENAQEKKTSPNTKSNSHSNGEAVKQLVSVTKRTDTRVPSASKHTQDRPKTSKQRVQMRREKTIVPKEKPSKLQREKTMGFKREKTMGLTRQKTMINDKSLKGKILIKTMSKEHLTSSPTLKSGLNAILLGSTSADLPSTAKIVRIFTSSTFKGEMCHRIQKNYRIKKKKKKHVT